jgi:energy-coupling factor transporter ATP-binding protein EcfA2
VRRVQPLQTAAAPALPRALTRLRDELSAQTLGLSVPGVQDARHVRDELVAQIDDYLLPRLQQMDAPLLMVVGGSTGAGKSTLVNSLVGAPVSTAGVLRPTTLAPVLVCHPDDLRFFQDDRILPGLPRSMGEATTTRGLQLVPDADVRPGLALLDAPDIDSVVEANRNLANQLLAAADSWLFVTTAARYADAVPWDVLHAARRRGTAISIVLNRVPPEAGDQVADHLREMLDEQGLGDTQLLEVPETALTDGMLPADALAPVRGWLDALAADAESRGALVRRTLAGALDSVGPRVQSVADGVAAQLEATRELRGLAHREYAAALTDVDATVRSGSLLRGEVLARWQEVVGTGDVMRAVEARVSWVRDRLKALMAGTPSADAELKVAVQTGVDAVLQTAAAAAAEHTALGWRQHPAGRALIAAEPALDGASGALRDTTADEVRAWQGFVFDLVREEGQTKRATARLASLGVNGAGLAVMIAVFASTGGLTGGEIVVAGGTSALSQKVLEAVFGDQAVRTLAERARADLMARVEAILEAERARFDAALAPLAPGEAQVEELQGAQQALEKAR